MEWHVLPSGRRIVICVRRNGMNKIEEIQAELRDRQIPAWLFYDHHHRDAISYRILGLPESLMVSRRWFYLIPAEGEPVKLVHRIEPYHLDTVPGNKQVYSSWQQLVDKLRELLSGLPAVAMQFSPNSMIFTASTADAGAIDLIRSFGVNVISSANLMADSKPLGPRSRFSCASLQENPSIPSGQRSFRKSANAFEAAARMNLKSSSGSWKLSGARILSPMPHPSWP